MPGNVLFHQQDIFDKTFEFCTFTLVKGNQEKTILMRTLKPQGPLKIRPFLLWDVNQEGFDLSKNKLLVIERTCSLGNLSDFKELVRFYGFETIKSELLKSASLDRKSLYFFSHFFNIPIEQFKCFSKKPLHLQQRNTKYDPN